MAAPVELHNAVAGVEPWLQRFARLGYVAKGIIYSLIGVFALLAAMGWGGKKTNQAGVLNSLGELPFGTVLLLTVGWGLLAYALWRLVEAAFDPESKGGLKRCGYVISALAYGGFGWAALSIALSGDRAQNNSQQSAARLFSLPMGTGIGMILGLAFVIGGVLQIWNGLTGKFMSVLNRDDMSDEQQSLARWTGGLGLTARGALFGLIGWLLWRASQDANPGEAGGIDRALTAVAHAPFGPTLLACIAVGLICYGVFMWVQARFRRMTPIAPKIQNETH